MIDRHREFLSLLSQDIIENIDSYAIIQCGDCRHLMLDDNSVSLVVTSPPYVTSYEYADLHQLPAIWFGYLENLMDFRKKFIGSSFHYIVKAILI